MITTESGTSRETCARHVRRAISLASFNLEGYKLAWANPCPNPGHTPICSQIGKEMPEKSLANWKFSNFCKISSFCHIQPISAIYGPKEDSPRQLEKRNVSLEVYKHPGSPGHCLSWRTIACSNFVSHPSKLKRVRGIRKPPLFRHTQYRRSTIL